jgi:predicted alpha/beta-fold hydrolase
VNGGARHLVKIACMKDYRAPRWLAGHGAVGGNAQTIFPALYSRAWPQHPRADTRVAYRRERWATPDADFVDLDFLDAAPVAGRTPGHEPLLVLFHGLEGSSQSHYARAFAVWAHNQGWSCALPHFRGCSGELNLAPRTYHSGDHPEIDWILRRLATQHAGPLLAVGVSLGGNVLMRWVQEQGSDAARVVKAAVAISSPLDLAAAGQTLGRGFNRLIYTRMFLDSMKPKALAKLAQHPGLFDGEALKAARDLYAYDAIFTAPLHGFTSTEDYWARCSAKPHLKALRDVPVLLLNALNDPFMPAASLPTRADVGPAVTLWQPAEGGHVGFPSGSFPGHVADLPQAVGRWLHQHL